MSGADWSTLALQEEIVRHKERMGFNTTDSVQELELARGELAELEDALSVGARHDIGFELADVVIYLMTIAHIQGIDLGAAVRRKMAVNRCRRYERDEDGGLRRVAG